MSPPSANVDSEQYPNGTTDILSNGATKSQRNGIEDRASIQSTTRYLKDANGQPHGETGAKISVADNGGTDLKSNTLRTSVKPQNGVNNKAWDKEITISLPELDLGDSHAFLLLSWALLVYRSTEKNGESQFTFNNTTASISDVILEDGEEITKVLQRVKQLLGRNSSGEKFNKMELSNVAVTAEYSTEVSTMDWSRYLRSCLTIDP